MESLAQMGVQLLLFTLGLEFSLAKLRVVRNVALLGMPPGLASPAYHMYRPHGVVTLSSATWPCRTRPKALAIWRVREDVRSSPRSKNGLETSCVSKMQCRMVL